MSPVFRKIMAIVMICITSLGILLSLFFMVQIWRIRQPVTIKLQAALKTTSSLLQTTLVGLDVIDNVVTNVYSSTLYLDDATNTLAQTIDNTDQFFDSAGSMIGDNLTNTISDTQLTLESAQSSALVVDNILGAISKIPLIGLNYNPVKPLSSAIGDVSTSLDPIQESLQGFQENISSTQSNLQLLVQKLEQMEQNINQINQNLAASQAVIEKYQTQVTSLKAWVDKAIISMPTWVTTTCVIVSFFILLIIFVQAAILFQGIYMLTGPAIEMPGSPLQESRMVETRDSAPDFDDFSKHEMIESGSSQSGPFSENPASTETGVEDAIKKSSSL
jgi:uncharacterized protein YukE